MTENYRKNRNHMHDSLYLSPIREQEESDVVINDYEEKQYINYDLNDPMVHKAWTFMYQAKAFDKPADDFLATMMGYVEAQRQELISTTKKNFEEITKITKNFMKDLVDSDEWRDAYERTEDEKNCAEALYDLFDKSKRPPPPTSDNKDQ